MKKFYHQKKDNMNPMGSFDHRKIDQWFYTPFGAVKRLFRFYQIKIYNPIIFECGELKGIILELDHGKKALIITKKGKKHYLEIELHGQFCFDKIIDILETISYDL
ncbi:MAG: hypothetical protein K8S23_03470 [Candidatus Cloacimonetes bacterium]|nr:hypothetical protein [Candidatus Cloacimonadota bacterium]